MLIYENRESCVITTFSHKVSEHNQQASRHHYVYTAIDKRGRGRGYHTFTFEGSNASADKCYRAMLLENYM